MTAQIRVRAVGAILVPDFEKPTANPQSYVGRTWVYEDGEYRLKSSSDAVSLPCRLEYLWALRDGSLAPADSETASLAGISFDPSAGPLTAPVEE